MARENFAIERGLRIFDENSDTGFIDLLSGVGAPLGTSGKTDEAPIGSVYTNRTNGDLYLKTADTSSASDWDLNAATAATSQWREEYVDAVTGDTLSSGAQNPTTWTDNDTPRAAADFTVGNYVLDGTNKLWQIDGVSAPSISLTDVGVTQPVTNDQFAVKYYLPDPAGQENNAIVVYDGTSIIKVADVDFSSALAISLSGSYTPVGGDPTSGDSVETAIGKLDDNLDDLTSTVGVSQGAQDMGTYTGTVINDNESAKQNIQQLETYAEATRVIAEGNAVTVTGITTATTVDSVDVDDYRSVVWLVTAFREASPSSVESFEFHALNNGSGAGDANTVDDAKYARLKSGSNLQLTVSAVLAGSGVSQTMGLQISTGGTAVTVTAVRLGQTPSGY